MSTVSTVLFGAMCRLPRKPRMRKPEKPAQFIQREANEASATHPEEYTVRSYCTCADDCIKTRKMYTRAFRVHREKRASNQSRQGKMHIRSKSITSRTSASHALSCPQPAQSASRVQSSRSALLEAPCPDSS